MKLHVDPPMNRWPVAHFDPTGSSRLDWPGRSSPAIPIIATGHQAGFWHPGILAKCLAAIAHAQAVKGQAVHVLVDHDDNDAMRLELPVTTAGDDSRLSTITLHLAPSLPGVALRDQPVIDFADVVRLLHQTRDQLGARLRADLQPIIDAATDMARGATGRETQASPAPTRADQWASFTQLLWRPIIASLPIVPATELVDHSLVALMVEEAPTCVRCYNEAVATHSQAGITPLLVERDRVELPLWLVGRPGAVRERVYADLADSSPLLVTAAGEEVEQVNGRFPGIAPRALTLTAMLRSRFCDLFIHGHGGGIYDRVMEVWWRTWRGSNLAPMAVVSADVQLPLPTIPDAAGDQLARAIWYAHHLPHNLDRHLPAAWIDPAIAARKRELLAHMDDDQNPRRRAAAFHELHQINNGLAAQHAAIIQLAQDQKAHAHTAAANRTIAQRRDWCFALYPKQELEKLKAQMMGR